MDWNRLGPGVQKNVKNSITELRNFIAPNGEIFYVDAGIGTTRDGSSWGNAFLTVQEAITASNALIDWSADPWLVDNWIFIAPGEYAEALTCPYSAHMIGMGVLGTDTAVEIHPAEGACLSGTGLGLHIENIRFEVTDASPAIDFGICNNTMIKGCEIVCGVAGTGTHGISTETATHLVVVENTWQYGGGGNGFDYGIYAAGGADKYFHNCRVERNEILGIASGGTGIYIAADCTASEARIIDNVIYVAGAGKGIDDNNGNSLCIGNRIVVGSGGDAIEHAGGNAKLLDNKVNVNGTVNNEPDIAND